MQLQLRTRRLDLSAPVVMGVLNVTPDSFSDGGRFIATGVAVARGLEMAGEGAALLDVGGESTRPGAAPVAVDEELARVVPVIEALAAAGAPPVSIDTAKPEVMLAAARAGAEMINDVRALRAPGALEAAAASGCAVCLMHMQGEPRTMQAAPAYTDVVEEVYGFLAARIEACVAAGIEPARIVVDPGFGFGKTLAHNLLLMKRLERFTALGVPVLVGVSRKSMLGAVTGRPVEQRLAGGLALAALAVSAGARIIRSHDVAATLDAAGMTAAVLAAHDGREQG
ncbi:MAG: dihydropteroate synthase [Gammaproteobacteria bacterium]